MKLQNALWTAVMLLLSPLARPALAGESAPLFQLVESWPVETSLDNPELPQAHEVWLEMIAGARERLDIAEFYITSEPGHRMEPVLDAIVAAGARGVKVRVLVDSTFYAKNYQKDVDRLAVAKGVELKKYEVERLMGGVLHAKYFLVDGRGGYVGSQNFDWRSLEHVQELGVRFQDPELALALQEVFEADWAWAGGAARESIAGKSLRAWPVKVQLQLPDGALSVMPVASPTGWLPSEEMWDLPRIIELIDGAKKKVRFQLLNYHTRDYEGRAFPEIEDAIRRASARGVEVEILLSDWSAKRGAVDVLKGLEALPQVTVKLVSIPEWSGGFVDFARTVHSKYLVVDGARSWLGTSNWGRDYFHESRNVGFIVEGPSFASRLDRGFDRLWSSPYASQIDPLKQYQAPKTRKD